MSSAAPNEKSASIKMRADRIFESVLYSNDLIASEQFYKNVLGLEVLDRSKLFIAFRCGEGVLLIFDPEKSSAPGRNVPSHGSTGPGHLAFAAREEDIDSWRSHLVEKGVDIETEVEWSSGGLSIYFRDPSGNSIELASPTLWGGGWGF